MTTNHSRKPRRGPKKLGLGAAPPKQATTVAKGKHAEQLTLTYLKRQGLRLVERNYRCRAGEVDLILRDGQTLAFVEVRSRISAGFISPKESVNWRKQQRLARVAACYLRARPHLAHCPMRFDVVSLTWPNHRARFEWIKNAFHVHDSF